MSLSARGAMLGALAASAVIGACSLVDTSGLAGSPVADAGADSSDAATFPSDVIAETAADSGSPQSDAGPPTDAGDAGADSGCASFSPKPTFCDDFDRTGLGATWSEVDPQSALWSLDHVAFSPPSSFKQVLPTLDGGAEDTQFRKDLTGTFSSVDFSIEVRLDAIGPSDITAITPFRFKIGTVDYSVGLRFQANQTSIFEDGYDESTQTTLFFSDHPLHPGVTMGAWTRLEIHVEISPAPSCTVKTDGLISLETGFDPSWPSGASPSIELGQINHAEPAPPVTINFDDVAIWLHP